MMLCAKNKKVQYCFQCNEFPCSILNAFASDGAAHHKKTVESLHRMKQIGMDAWIAEQEKNGKCEFCPGTRCQNSGETFPPKPKTQKINGGLRLTVALIVVFLTNNCASRTTR
jgi:hypothetical protein